MTGGAGGGLVHPVDSGLRRGLAGGFLQALEFLDLALFVPLAPQLIDAFALLEGAFLFRPDALLVAEEGGVP